MKTTENTPDLLIKPPEKIPLMLRPMVKIADKKAGKEMLPGRLLSWSPSIAISSGLLEVYVEKGARKILDKRLIKLIRLIISYSIGGAFGIDINAVNYSDFNITETELDALRGAIPLTEVNSFTEKERAALTFALALTATPVNITDENKKELKKYFSDKEITAVAALSSKVNYWVRLIVSLGVPPAGYTDDPAVHLEDYM